MASHLRLVWSQPRRPRQRKDWLSPFAAGGTVVVAVGWGVVAGVGRLLGHDPLPDAPPGVWWPVVLGPPVVGLLFLAVTLLSFRGGPDEPYGPPA